MLKRISVLLLLLAFSCSTEEPAEEDGDVKNPIYLDSNGATIKAHSWAEIGDTGVINEKTIQSAQSHNQNSKQSHTCLFQTRTSFSNH